MTILNTFGNASALNDNFEPFSENVKNHELGNKFGQGTQLDLFWKLGVESAKLVSRLTGNVHKIIV